MAIFHCQVKVIGRSAGKSAVAAAAYRSGEELTNEYDGITHDYNDKNWISYKEIMLPEGAPEEYADRETLWNAVEKAESASDARLARELEIALPVELSRQEQIELLHRYSERFLVSEGMCADIAIHNPPVTDDRHRPIDVSGKVTHNQKEMIFRNPHAHILVTVRPLDKNGRWEYKSEKEYLCRKDKEEQAFTAKEFTVAKIDGWEKQYRYIVDGTKVWMTPSEAEKEGFKRADKNPKTTPYGRKNPKTEKWNSPEQIVEWRKGWEETANEMLKEKGSNSKIDSRSFAEQGRASELPTLHMGVSATNMERRAEREEREGKNPSDIVHSDIGNINSDIKKHNAFIQTILETAHKLREKLEKIFGKEYTDRKEKGLENDFTLDRE